MIELSTTTRQLVSHLFPSPVGDQVTQLLEHECAENLPLTSSPDAVGLERIRFAVIRASDGDIDRLLKLISLAQQDWRDVLVVAEFANSVDEHRLWADRVLAAARLPNVPEETNMPNYICTNCGNQYGASEEPPLHCLICEDEREFVNPEGQSWTTLDEVKREHRNVLSTMEPGLSAIETEPKFAIGQRALLVQASKGNVLWDCVSLIDNETVEAIQALGGISALAMSHPHMFGSMVDWSHAFGDAPIYLHTDYQQWIQRPDPVIEFWDGEDRNLAEGPTLHRCGGHFKGSTVLLWPEGAEGRGVLLSSDGVQVAKDRRHVSFMYSYPNYIPLAATMVDRIVDKVLQLKFDRIYSAFHYLEIEADAKEAVQRSADRYKQAIG